MSDDDEILVNEFLRCSCDQFDEIGSGTISIIGDSIIETSPECILSIDDDSIVRTNSIGEGFEAIYLLNEEGSGDEGEYLDLCGRNHGTGGGGNPDGVFAVANGLLCQNSQLGTTQRQWIELNSDSINWDQGFAVSFWCRLEGNYTQNPLFQRGNFTVSTSWMNHLMVSIKTDELTYRDMSNFPQFFPIETSNEPVDISAYSSQILENDRWYHVGISWNPHDRIRIYLNGELAGSVSTPFGSILEPLVPINQIGRLESGRGFTGQLQDLRLSAEVRSEDWFFTEYRNYCGDLVEIYSVQPYDEIE